MNKLELLLWVLVIGNFIVNTVITTILYVIGNDKETKWYRLLTYFFIGWLIICTLEALAWYSSKRHGDN